MECESSGVLLASEEVRQQVLQGGVQDGHNGGGAQNDCHCDARRRHRAGRIVGAELLSDADVDGDRDAERYLQQQRERGIRLSLIVDKNLQWYGTGMYNTEQINESNGEAPDVP